MTVRHDPVEPRLVRADRSMIPGHVGGTIRSASLVRPRSDLAQPFGGAAGTAVGGTVATEWVWLERRATQSMASGGADIVWDTEITDPPRQGMESASYLPTATLTVGATSLVRAMLWWQWDTYAGPATVEITRIRAGTAVAIWTWPAYVSAGQSFADLTSLPFQGGDDLRFRIVQTSGVAQTLSSARLVIEALPTGGAAATSGAAVPEVWFKADAITGLADGAALATWTDSSGNNRHVTQGTASAQPTYRTNILNGLPVVHFTSDHMHSAAFSPVIPAPYTIFTVWKENSGAYTGGDFLEAHDAFRVNANDGGWYWPVSFVSRDTAWHLWTLVYDGANSLLRRDGAQTAAGTAGTASMGGISLGSRAWGGPGDGYIAEIRVFKRRLIDSEITQFEDSLKTKWGLL